MKTRRFVFLGALLGAFYFLLPNILLAADLNSFYYIGHGGVDISQGDTVYKNQLTHNNDRWTFVFDWPEQVHNADTTLIIFRGVFGNLEGGVAVENENYAAQLQIFNQGLNIKVKTFALPNLLTPDLDSHEYTVLIAQRDGQSLDDVVLWFESGGVEGVEPKDYSMLEFSFEKYGSCCSSVVFLPGIKASELIRRDTDDRLWPPSLLSAEILELLFDENGTSVNDVYVGDIIDQVFNVGVYDEFIEYMDGLVSDGTINQWLPVAYDWRHDVRDIIEDGITYKDVTLDLISTIENIASNSDTGKVSIVAHSNGGLLGKVLIDALDEIGKGTLVDDFITIGTPHVGTPQAVPALLHGYDESISFLVAQDDARVFARSVPGGYMLIPSDKYMNEVIDPVLIFDTENENADEWREEWGIAISNYDELSEFILGDGSGRIRPDQEDITLPEILKQEFFNNNTEFHQKYDSWVAPDTLNYVSVAGWGIPTVKSFVYTPSGPRPLFTIEGDGTVISESANEGEGNYYLHLKAFNEFGEFSFKHRDMMNAEPVQAFITEILDNTGDEVVYMTLAKPVAEDAGDRLLISTHSPVTLSVYDSFGNHTGLAQNPNLNSDIDIIEEHIPNSMYYQFGDESYISLPSENEYNIQIFGTGNGALSFEVEDSSQHTYIGCSDITVNETTEMYARITLLGDILLEIDDGNAVFEQDIHGWSSISENSGDLQCGFIETIIYTDSDSGVVSSVAPVSSGFSGTVPYFNARPHLSQKVYAGEIYFFYVDARTSNGQLFDAERYLWAFNGQYVEGKTIQRSFPVPDNIIGTVDISINKISTSHLFRIEVLPARLSISDVVFGDRGYIEVFNKGDRMVDLSGWALRSGMGTFTIPPHTYILPEDKVKFSSAATHLNSRTYSEIELLYPNTEVVHKYEI